MNEVCDGKCDVKSEVCDADYCDLLALVLPGRGVSKVRGWLFSINKQTNG